MKSTKYTLWHILFPVLSLLAIGGSVIQAGQQDRSSFGQLLQKNAEPLSAATLKSGQPKVTIRLNNVQDGDLVNIRPVESRVAAAVGTLRKTAQLQNGMASEPIIPGPTIHESALVVTPSMLTFARTAPTRDMVFLDIEVPAGAEVRVIADGKTILRAKMKRPLSLYNNEWFPGSATRAGTISRAGIALSGHGNILQNLREGDYQGVSFSELQLLERYSPRGGSPGQSVFAVLYVNEAGSVVDVTPLADAPQGFERTLKTWRFAPYVINGKPISVSTVVQIKFQ